MAGGIHHKQRFAPSDVTQIDGVTRVQLAQLLVEVFRAILRGTGQRHSCGKQACQWGVNALQKGHVRLLATGVWLQQAVVDRCAGCLRRVSTSQR